MSRTANEIRRQFIDFFVSRHGHTTVASSPVVPHDDPTLLFTNAGMNQFKDVFLGRGSRPYGRAVNSQKCIRAGGKHNDLEDVGRDTYHHTFFEMLGTWSFGDYFKRESIAWGWELLTGVFGIEPERLYATYFGGDEKAGLAPDHEARDFWLAVLPSARVLPGNMKDNFWEMGETGPCGPCSEIHVDRIGGRDAASLVNMGDPDVIEIWNHVFIQFNRESDGTLKPLPARHVDTGMGLERLVSVLQGARSNYDTDLFRPIFDAIAQRTKARPYGGDLTDATDVAYRVLADHMRCLTVALADGAQPGADGRNYVLRRILRRAVRHGHQTLGMNEPFLHDLVPAVIDVLGEAFPDLAPRATRVAEIIHDEEVAFGRTLDRGLSLFAEAAERATAAGGIGGRIGGQIGGEDAFRLHDTFGFPIDLTQIMAEERGLSVDVEGYEARMAAARETSRRGGSAESALEFPPDALAKLEHLGIHATHDEDKFHGRPIVAEVRAIWNGHDFDDAAEIGRTVALILDRTNHYAEAGGQEGDHGRLHMDAESALRGRGDVAQRAAHGGATFRIDDTRSVGGHVLHIGHVTEGSIRVHDRGALTVQRDRREALRGNHTATHLLNLALRAVVGDEVEQRGSLVAEDRLRFDFSCGHALSADQAERVEAMVNEGIERDLAVYADVVALEQARRIRGVRAVFGERYPDPVRVVCIGAPVAELLADPENDRWLDLSIEFCGGTHLDRTGAARHFTLVSEGALASGVRRIFGLTGTAAQAAAAAGKSLLERIAAAGELDDDALPAEFDEIAPQADSLTMSVTMRRHAHARLEPLRDRVKAVRKRLSGASRDTLVAKAREIADQAHTHAIVHELPSSDRDALLAALDAVRARRPELAVMLFGRDPDEEKVTIVAAVPPEMVKQGFKAGDWVRAAAPVCGGSGGGRPDMAQAGGKERARIPDAMLEAANFAATRLGAGAGS